MRIKETQKFQIDTIRYDHKTFERKADLFTGSVTWFVYSDTGLGVTEDIWAWHPILERHELYHHLERKYNEEKRTSRIRDEA